MPVRFRQAPGLPSHKEIIDLSGHWHMLIINMKVKVANSYCNISDPSTHHEISSPRGQNRSQPVRSNPPPLATLFLSQWHPEGTFPPCHPRCVTHCTKTSSCPEGFGSRGLPPQISRNDQDKRLLWVTLPVKARTWCFKSHLCSKLHVDTMNLLSIVCVCYLWGFLRVVCKLMDKEERLQDYKNHFPKSSSLLCFFGLS